MCVLLIMDAIFSLSRRLSIGFVGENRMWGLPLTLTLSPQAGRGDLPYERTLFEETSAAYPLRPACGEKVPAGG